MAGRIRFTKAAAKPKKPKQSGSKKKVLTKLNSYLKQAEPETVEFLYHDLQATGNAVTYKELREAYISGGMTQEQFEKWQHKYSKLVTGTLKPKWEQEAALAAQEIKDKYPYFLYEPSASAATSWIKDHGAELVTNLAKDQVDALNAMVGHFSGNTAITPDEAARMMRPCIGLTKPQALANLHYQEAVKAAYLKQHPKAKQETLDKKAKDAGARYAARQHRYRAQSIARTELAFGYNAGAYGATKDAQAQGYIGECKKKWLTAYDERVCPICSAMDEETVDMDAPFSNGKLLPPGHPQCRCAVAYEETDSAALQPQAANGTMNTQTQPQPQPQPQGTAAQPPLQTAPAIPQPAKTPVKTDGGYMVSEVMDDLTVLPNTQNGVAIRSDGGMLEQMNLSGRRVTINGRDEYEISGKLTEETWEAVAKNAKSRGYQRDIEFLMRNPDGTYSTSNVGMKIDGFRILDTNQSAFEVYADYANKQQFSMAGYFRVRVPATGNAAADKKALEQILDKAGLRNLTVDPTDAEELLLKKTRIAWQRDPKAMESCRHLTGAAREKEINKILKSAGIDDARVSNMKLKEIFPGYSTYVDDAAAMEYRKAGATHIWAGVDGEQSVVAICRSDGLTATNYRITGGMKKCGASPGADMKSGGADNVFVRLGVKNNNRYGDSYLGDEYRIIIDQKELTRTDWYAHEYDRYGISRPDDWKWLERPSSTQFIKDMKKNYQCGNEIMFRHGISTDSFVGISCQTESNRTRLLNAFHDAGITEMNGVRLEDFIQVTKEIGEDSMRGIVGLSGYNAPF